MNNPISALGLVLLTTIFIPIILSVTTYDLDEINTDIDYKTKKILNYETINEKSPIIELYNHKIDKTYEIDMEEYLIGVVSAEMPSDFHKEALKAQAVAARTYVLYNEQNRQDNKHKDAVVCTDHTHCQAYLSYEELKEIKGKDWIENDYQKIVEAVNSTKGQVITYNNEVILPLYFSTSSGKTENSAEVFSVQEPYLQSVESNFDNRSPKYESEISISVSEFVDSIKSKYNNLEIDKENIVDSIEVLEYSEGGSIENIKIGNIQLEGRDLRSIFKLNSSNFELKIDNKNVIFLVKGYGHGVGMSQWGADGMASEGSMYYEILKHYYTGVEITDKY